MENMQNENLTISLEEIAELLGVCTKTVKQIINNADGFPAIQLKRRTIINRKKFYEWFDNI